MEKNNVWQKLRKLLLNKYAITLFVFAVILIFVGEHSLLQYVKRATKMRAMQEQLEITQQEIEKAQRVLESLDNTDSLEQFARETYRMHAPNEDVYVIEP